jgi:hypothetical protein
VQQGESRAKLEGPPRQRTLSEQDPRGDLFIRLAGSTCLAGERIHRGSALLEPGRVRSSYGRCLDAARASALRPRKDGLCGRLASG